MAERRISITDRVTSARSLAVMFDGVAPPSPMGWIIEDGADAVLQPFYAALDSERRLCWTDDRARAECFASKQAAERFAVDRLTSEAKIVPQG